ncbi:MAG: helix-turn-helix domain-containing protein [Alphaproteobacteria bacterium]|nr:helix-turn-helix domain-containing protein [Alphaproteobacteria bacterium]MBU0859627.1 helix-turn-helix domain-containing protein [Alphaproteobacteria bacterium]
MNKHPFPKPRRPRVSAADRIIGETLRRLRLERGVSQEAVAFMLGVSYQQVQKYESGTNRISLARLLTLRDFYGVTLESFLEDVPATRARAPAPVEDPDMMALCRKLASIPDRDLRQKARRILDTLLSHG